MLAINTLFIENEILVHLFIPSDLTDSHIPNLNISLNQTHKLFIVEEGNSFAAFSSEVVSNLVENGLNNFSLGRIANNTIIPSSRELEKNVLPTSNKIHKAIIDYLK